MSSTPSAAGTAMPFHLQAIDVLLLVILALAALSGWRRGFAMVLLGDMGLLVRPALGVGGGPPGRAAGLARQLGPGAADRGGGFLPGRGRLPRRREPARDAGPVPARRPLDEPGRRRRGGGGGHGGGRPPQGG